MYVWIDSRAFVGLVIGAEQPSKFLRYRRIGRLGDMPVMIVGKIVGREAIIANLVANKALEIGVPLSQVRLDWAKSENPPQISPRQLKLFGD